jgi:hypothetical protein
LVAGEPVRGSGSAHPKAHTIFQELQRLADDPDILVCKFLDGKRTFVHRRLWPALARVKRERSLFPPISPEAKRLLTRVRRSGSLVATAKPRLELERALLVVGLEEHTETGAHRTVIVPFETWIPAEVARESNRLTLNAAMKAMRLAGWSPGTR